MRDISKTPLKNMVFDPSFGKEFVNYQDIVIYKVNNTHTEKTLAYLSKMYFGTEEYWEKIKNRNNLAVTKEDVLAQDKEIIIPNY